MSDSDLLEEGTELTLKGKEFDEACHLCADDDNAKVFVHQKPEGSGRWDFCFSFAPGEYDEALLLEQLVMDYGPGEYPVQIRSQSDSGQPRIRWQKNMRVVARRRPQSQLQAAPAAPASDAIAVALENQTRLLAAVLEKVSQPAPVAQEKTAIDFAKDLKAMKDLFATDNKSPFEMIKETLELQKLLTDSSGGDTDPLTKALNMFGPKIVEELDAQKTRPANAAQPQLERPAAPQPVVEQRPAAEVQPTFAHIDVDAAFSIFAENYMSRLLALPGEPSPEDLGKYIARLVGSNEQLLHVVGLVIEQDDMVQRLAAYDARVLDRAAWLDSIADWLAHALWPDTNPAPTPENATIHATSDENPDSQGINGANEDGAHAAGPEGANDVETVGNPGEPGTSTSPGKLDNDP